ncbi:unnamed protein product [Paramecium octaurelia]|uniref:Transmembrane protein n=1 Tax=Paramecium octaurelia TaxID=43137 RepID=A0A8S1VXP0_PAROT|nr:unnamed protein product [Paramecium octaurelia]
MRNNQIFFYRFKVYVVYYNNNITISIQDYSGQFLNYNMAQNETNFNIKLLTSSIVGKLKQSYQLDQFISIQIQQLTQYLIGINNQLVYILNFNYSEQNQSNQFSEICSINISINANSLKAAYNFYPSMMIIIGLSANTTIYLFNYYYNTKSIIRYSKYTFRDKFSNFLVTYNNILLLRLNKTVEIMIFDFKNYFYFKLIINKQIVQQYTIQSNINSCENIIIVILLFITNINEVIIISNDQNSLPIPISLIKVNFKILQINLVYQQLILSYLCYDDDKNTCFKFIMFKIYQHTTMQRIFIAQMWIMKQQYNQLTYTYMQFLVITLFMFIILPCQIIKIYIQFIHLFR